MKKILIVLLSLLTLVGCTNQTNETQKNIDEDPLIMHVNAKDHAEFFLVKQGTSIDDFNPEDIIEVELNKNVSYEIKWVGERYAYQYNTYEELNKKINDDRITSSKSDTLEYESIRPISIYVIADDGGVKVEKRIDTLLLIAPEILYNDLSQMDVETIEDVYQKIAELGKSQYGTYNGENRTKDIYIKDGYVSNISSNYDY